MQEHHRLGYIESGVRFLRHDWEELSRGVAEPGDAAAIAAHVQDTQLIHRAVDRGQQLAVLMLIELDDGGLVEEMGPESNLHIT